MRSGDSSKYCPSDQWNDAFIRLQQFQTEALSHLWILFLFNNSVIVHLLHLISFSEVHLKKTLRMFSVQIIHYGWYIYHSTELMQPILFCYVRFAMSIWSVFMNDSYRLWMISTSTPSPKKQKAEEENLKSNKFSMFLNNFPLKEGVPLYFNKFEFP